MIKNNPMDKVESINKFWFGHNPKSPLQNLDLWKSKDPIKLKTIKELFLDDMLKAYSGDYNSWRNFPRGSIALLILSYYFPCLLKTKLNMESSLKTSKMAIRYGMNLRMKEVEKFFCYLPLIKSTNINDQQLARNLYSSFTLIKQYKELNNILEDNLP